MNTLDWKNATPEQINLWKKVTSLLVGVQTITPIYYIGVIVGTEFLVYDVNKLYLAFELSAEYSTPVAIAATALMTIYNEANAVSGYSYNASPAWDTTAAAMKTTYNPLSIFNLYFSRFAITTYSYMRFNGYRITIP